MTLRKSGNSIGVRVNNLRLDHNDSVRELADYLKTSIKVVYNIESDLSKPNAEQSLLICKKYKVSIEYLLYGSK